jgi:hypothetical protein
VITLRRDTLTFTFPEISREVRALVNRKIKQLAAQLPPTWDRDAKRRAVLPQWKRF